MLKFFNYPLPFEGHCRGLSLANPANFVVAWVAFKGKRTLSMRVRRVGICLTNAHDGKSWIGLIRE